MTENFYKPISEINIGVGLGQPNEITTKMPGIQMLDVNDLVIDTRYQRVITSRGRSNIRHIVEHFDWMHFQPILVSPVEVDGEQKYAVVDGQHRVLAAINHPDVQLVPSAVVHLAPEQQAHVFAEINSRIVKVNDLEIYWARYASGCEDAAQIMNCVRDADLEMSRIMLTCTSEDQIERARGKFWSPKMLYGIVDFAGFGNACNALYIASQWDIDAPQAANAKFVIEALAYYLRAKEITDPEPLITKLANRCDWAAVREATASESKSGPGSARAIFEQSFMMPAFEGGALVAA